MTPGSILKLKTDNPGFFYALLLHHVQKKDGRVAFCYVSVSLICATSE